jgi:hypothetical protein
MGAELDEVHSERLLRLLRGTGGQILATGTAPPDARSPLYSVFCADAGGAAEIGAGLRLFHVEQGTVRQV